MAQQNEDRWYCQSNDGWISLPLQASRRICQAQKNAITKFLPNEINQYSYHVIRTTRNCAWQQNKSTNKVRPLIRNIDEVKDETEILNERSAHNPFAATKKDQMFYLGQDYQRFAEIFPGDAYVGGEYKWLHCHYMNDDRIKQILLKTGKIIENVDHLMDNDWVNPMKSELNKFSPLEVAWFNKMIQLYTREGGNMYCKLNWNLRANEWYNVQKVLSSIVFALKCVCEGYCYRVFGDERFAPYDGTVHRVFNWTKSIATQIADFSVGDKIYFGGFTSTTKNLKMTQKIAETRGFQYIPMKSGIYLRITVYKEHRCAVDITEKSQFNYEEEVLISCFTRFKITSIQNPPNSKYIAVCLTSLPPVYTTLDHWESEKKIREELASYAYQYQFESAIKLIKEHKDDIPELVNSTRPDSSKFWTIGHQVYNSKNKVEYWMNELHDLGYWDGARNHLGETIYNLNQTKEKHKQKSDSTGCFVM